MIIQIFKGVFLLFIISIFSACQFTSSKEKQEQSANEIEALGKQAFSFLQSFDTLEIKTIQTLMPSFDTCKGFYFKESKDRAYSIEHYDKSVAMTIGLIENIQTFDSTIHWKEIEFRDFSYMTYFHFNSEPFFMSTVNSSSIKSANFIAGVIHLRSKKQNYKVEVYWKKLLDKWYLIRFRQMQKAFTY